MFSKNFRLVSFVLVLFIFMYFFVLVTEAVDFSNNQSKFNNISWKISINSISDIFSDFSVKKLFKFSNYESDGEEIFLNLSSMKLGFSLNSNSSKDYILDMLFINLLKDISRIANNMDIFNCFYKRNT